MRKQNLKPLSRSFADPLRRGLSQSVITCLMTNFKAILFPVLLYSVCIISCDVGHGAGPKDYYSEVVAPLFGEVRDSLTGDLISGAFVAQYKTGKVYKGSRLNIVEYIDSIIQAGGSDQVIQKFCFVYGYSDVDGRCVLKYDTFIGKDYNNDNILYYYNLPTKENLFACKKGYKYWSFNASKDTLTEVHDTDERIIRKLYLSTIKLKNL